VTELPKVLSDSKLSRLLLEVVPKLGKQKKERYEEERRKFLSSLPRGSFMFGNFFSVQPCMWVLRAG